jgi:hypothetical protein
MKHLLGIFCFPPAAHELSHSTTLVQGSSTLKKPTLTSKGTKPEPTKCDPFSCFKKYNNFCLLLFPESYKKKEKHSMRIINLNDHKIWPCFCQGQT